MIVVDENLPIGIIANTAAILGITMGMKMPDVVGNDVSDLEGNFHMGIIQFPVPILKGNTELLKSIRTKLLAQGCKTYDEFIDKMANTSERELKYIGIAICGNKKQVNKLTGNLPLLR